MKNAFTIIEVLIAVLIIGIMVTLSIPTFEGAMIKAKFPEIFAGVSRLEGELDYLILENGFDQFNKNKQALEAARDTEISQDIFEYAIVTHITGSPNSDYYAIEVTVKDVAGGKLCSRVFYRSSRKWNIYTAHPWSKYLSIPGADQVSIVPGP